MRVDVTVQVCAHDRAGACGGEGSRERSEIEAEVEQEQGHPFKSSPQRLCPTFLSICFTGAQRRGKEGMKDEGWAKVLKQIQDVGGRGRSILLIENITKIASVWQVRSAAEEQRRRCLFVHYYYYYDYALRRTGGKQPLWQHKQMDGHSHIRSHSLKKKKSSPLAKSMTSNLCAQLGGQPINNSLLSKSVYLLPHKALPRFLFVFSPADLYCGILANTGIGKPHLSER